MPWKECFLKRNTGFFAPETGLNLRSGPGIHNSKIVTLRGDSYSITLTGKLNGLWAEVEVELWEGNCCEEDCKVINNYKGWIKLLDNKGYPNVWFYTRGC